jgi:hypothetical protein
MEIIIIKDTIVKEDLIQARTEFNYKIKIMLIRNNSNSKYQFKMEAIIIEMKIYYVQYLHCLKN